MADNTLFEVDAALRHHRRDSPSGWYSPRLNLCLVESDDEALLDHEMNHFTVHAATSYGSFHRMLKDLTEVLVADYAMALREKLPDLRVPAPIYNFARAFRQQPDIMPAATREVIGGAIEDYIAPWSALAALQTVFEGGPTRPAVACSMERGCELLSRFESLWLQRARRPAERWHPVVAKPEEVAKGMACPLVTTSANQRVAIGALHLTEAIAMLIEHKTKVYVPRHATDDDHYMDYAFLWSWYLASLARTGRFSQDDMPLYRNTFLLCALLALFSPCGPHFMDLRGEGCGWQDIHPGWRFQKAIQTSLKIGLVEDIQADGLPFMQRICEAQGWPAITDMLHLGAGLPDDTEARSFTRMALIHQQVALAPQPDSQLVERLFNAFIERHGPVTYIRSLGALRIPIADMGHYNGFVINAILSEWCWAAMLSGVPKPAQVFSHGVEFCPFEEDPVSNAEFLRRMIARNPWMDPARYTEQGL